MHLELAVNFNIQHTKYPLLNVPEHTDSLEISLFSLSAQTFQSEIRHI